MNKWSSDLDKCLFRFEKQNKFSQNTNISTPHQTILWEINQFYYTKWELS